jgi:hypothetical protein
MSTHTPGPWGLALYAKGAHPPIPFKEHKTLTVFSDGFKRGDVAYMQHGLWGGEQAFANARLIAAAPELLDALRELTIAAEAAGWDVDTANAPILNAARAALAKATSEAA